MKAKVYFTREITPEKMVEMYDILLILRNLISHPNYGFSLLPAFEIDFSMRQAGY